jgi:hypothetical protein
MFTRVVEPALEHPCCSTSINRGSLKIASDPARFHPARRGMVSQSPTQFCLANTRGPIALKCLGQE